MCFKKNSHYLSRFSDLLFEKVVPELNAQTWKFPEPGEPCEKHIKGASLPQTQLYCFSWRWSELPFRKISKVSVTCYELKVILWTGSEEGPESACQSTWKQMCTGNFVAEERKSGRKTQLGLWVVRFHFASLQTVFPSSFTRGRPAISCACATRRGLYPSWSKESWGQLQTWEDSGSSLGSTASSRGHPQTP